MPNLFVISSLIFSLYVSGFLIVRDECERVWRLKLKRMNKWISRVSREKLTCERVTCRAHDWKVKSHASLEVFASVSRERPTCEILVKHSVWQNVMFCFTKSLPILYIHSLSTNCRVHFREKTLKITLEN